ncbi:MAG TPA: ABC transporter ATP-binding protein [Candidatus Hydrogenedentes bacterium]|nr:ABC transporter ATP-binding protein [Candidatus Hydrogenedentota bacterium]HPG70378.1 ABC transporter ATP-binding protein [Candidatus Hydrogenedentota bacterium]
MGEVALSIRGLEKVFPKFRLGPLDLRVPTGAIYGFIGPNGAGKTTTIDLIMGMGGKDGGEIEVFGLDHVNEEVAVKRQVGYVSPDLFFNAWGRVNRLIGFYRSFYPDWDDDYCTALLKRLKIGWTDKIATLSYGTRTKLGLVLALSHRPALLLLDEPFAGLDAVSKQEVLGELFEAVQDEKRTVFVSSHNLDDIERITDHLGIIHNGKLLLEDSTAALIERFRMADYTASNGATPATLPGVYVQKRDGDRWRLLLDTQADAAGALEAQGFREVSTSPVTLEELFVGLVKEA